MINKIFGKFSKDIGIDLGTTNTLVYVKDRGIVINEPSVVAINNRTGKIINIGQKAQAMIGRTPRHINIVKPLVGGVISDFETAEEMLRFFINKVHKETFHLLPRSRIVIGIPSRATEVERKSAEDATLNAGAREVFLIEEPMAAAIGARLPIKEAIGNMIVDIGGGTTEIALISLGGIVLNDSIKIAGNKMTQDIINYVQDNFSLIIGERTAERVKTLIGSVFPLKKELSLKIRGRDQASGLPREAVIINEEVREAIEKTAHSIVVNVKNLIEKSPPELIADLMSRGIILVGGGSLLRGLPQLMQSETEIPCKLEEDPLSTVARGTGIALENLVNLKEIMVNV